MNAKEDKEMDLRSPSVRPNQMAKETIIMTLIKVRTHEPINEANCNGNGNNNNDSDKVNNPNIHQ